MKPSSDLNLFGLDLSRVWGSVALGVRQLLYGREFGLASRFYPRAEVRDRIVQEDSIHSDADSPVNFSQVVGVVLPDDLVLRRQETLNLATEAHLHEVLAQTVELNSPFAPDQTVWGWRIDARDDEQLVVEVAMTSTASIEGFLSSDHQDLLTRRTPYEVWADNEESPIVFGGFFEGVRRVSYHKDLRQRAAKLLAATVIVGIVLYSPAAWMSIKAGQLEQLLDETQLRMSAVSKVRTDLVEAQQALMDANAFFEDRYRYHDWLNALAAITPDTVYFYRLEIDAASLSIAGFAENAADYQGRLASSGLFSDLLAPSPFAYDSRAARERFTLTMSLMEVKSD